MILVFAGCLCFLTDCSNVPAENIEYQQNNFKCHFVTATLEETIEND
jgi:hypothetical protein